MSAVHPVRASTPGVAELRARAEGLSGQFRRELTTLVGIDSGSWNTAGVEAVGAWCTARLRDLGFAVERVSTAPVQGHQFGSVIVARRRGRGIRRILLFAHMDTVFADGTAAERPYRECGGRAYGPGVSDDKGGLLAAIHGAQIVTESGFDDFAELVLVFTPDEEIGSPASQGILGGIAAGMDAAFCLECARENGDLVVARKGVADIRIDVRGRAAHSGVDPERGVSAAVEAAHLLLEAEALSGSKPGLHVNMGMIRSGDRANVVPASAQIHGEVRAATVDDLDATLTAIESRASKPVTAGATIATARVAVCPPLERTASTDALLGLAVEVGRELGIEVAGATTGGASDANFVAATGVPVLDGLGPIGGDDHAPGEWLDIDSAPARIALLAGLIIRVATG
ncbi:M20/M25/M40 family metallo-hydrolase [Microbacterium sp.]|uniref:M20/M25/M40 family metallo-hydrolase n=1 Tax=Microbacterium sp. TaxID=51671 RepID=UPI003F71A65E